MQSKTPFIIGIVLIIITIITVIPDYSEAQTAQDFYRQAEKIGKQGRIETILIIVVAMIFAGVWLYRKYH
jgi:hypothetical protein